jgi:N-6 DNA Methylase
MSKSRRDDLADNPAMEGLLRQILDSARTSGRDLEVALAVDAAKWWAARSGSPLPPLLEPAASGHQLAPDIATAQRSWLDAATVQDRQSYLPLVARRLSVPRQSGEHQSSNSIAEIATMVALARVQSGEGHFDIYDPAVGGGTMLVQAAVAASALGYTPRVLGQDINERTAAFAAASLFLAGFDAEVRVGNTLVDDEYPGKRANLAISEPPFGIVWGQIDDEVRDRQATSGWYEWGLPPRNDATWLFASRLVAKLRSRDEGGGRAVMLIAPTALRGSGPASLLRRAVLDADLVEAVVALPGELALHTDIHLFALALASDKPASRQGRVQVINLRPYFQVSRGRNGQRALRDDGLRALEHALSSTKDGPASRMVPNEYFLRHRVVARRGDTTGTSRDGEGLSVSPRWDVSFAGTSHASDLLPERYDPIKVTWEPHRDASYVSFEIDDLFETASRQTSKWAADLGWPVTRLSALLLGALTLFDGGSIADGAHLVLPTTSKGVAGSDLEVSPEERDDGSCCTCRRTLYPSNSCQVGSIVHEEFKRVNAPWS